MVLKYICYSYFGPNCMGFEFIIIYECFNNNIKNIFSELKQSTYYMRTSLALNADQCINKYNHVKESLQLPLKLKLYFTFLEAALHENSGQKSTHNFQGFSPLFYAIFCQLSKEQKAYYLYSNIQSIKLQSEKFEMNLQQKQNKTISGNSVTASGQISQSVMGLVYWSKVKVFFQYETMKIKLQTKNIIFTIDVRLYLIRKSKKYKSTLVLQAISEIVSQADRKISLFFKSTIFDEIYNEILKCIINYRNQQLFKIALQQSSQTSKQKFSQVSYIGSNSKSLNFLGSKNINQFLNFKDQVLKKLLRADFHFDNVYTDQNCKIGVDKSKNRFNQLYKLQANFNCSVEILKKNFLEKYKSQNFKYLMQSQKLQEFSNKYTAVYQKLMFKPSIFSYRTIQQVIIEELNQKEITCQNQQLIFQKGVNGAKMSPLLQFLMIKVKGMGTTNKSKLVVVGSFNDMEEINSAKQKKKRDSIEVQDIQQIIIMFLLQFSQMIFRKETQPENIRKILQQLRSSEDGVQQNYQNQFITVQGNFGGNDQLVLDADESGQQNQTESSSVPFIEPSIRFKKGLSLEQKLTSFTDTPITIAQNKRRESTSSFSEIAVKQISHLNHTYQLQPTPMIPGANPQKILQKKHFIFDEWNRKPKGSLLCKDLTAINEQKKVANYIITTLGKRLLEQKGGLMNLSLPVSIFKPESHLHSVARNLSFAPTLLEKACQMNPVQRMKMVILYALSVTVSSISVNKPFNPILGETLQVWIDGCPVYLEQISHHPPIVAYYMIGRGYKLYGSIGPKTSFGFNSIVGYAQQPNFVQFNDGTVIQLNFGKMVINGIIIGERTFSFSDKMYAIDSKNNLFCDMRLGKEKGSFFSMSNQPEDSVNGKILKVTSQFVKQFYNCSSVTYPNKSHVEEQMSSFEGSWNGKIQFDNKEYINFALANGCVVQDEKFPLPSNSSYRKDIQYLKDGCVNASQSEKQKLEMIQRRDQKLRVESKKQKQ